MELTQLTLNAHLGSVNICASYYVCGPKYTNVFFVHSNVGGIVVDQVAYFSEFRFVDLFRRYSRSESKVIRNRAEFWTLFFSPKF